MIQASSRMGSSLDADLVSVIIAVFQGERHIREAIASVLAQTHGNLQVLVIDDGSTDGTVSLVETITDPRVQVLRQANSGTAVARNLGLAHATGNYVAFIDHDDRWLPEKLATELAVLRAAPDPVGIAYSWYYAVDEHDRLLHSYISPRFSGDVFDALLENDNFLIPSVTLFHRKVIDTVGGFSNIFHEDHSFAIKVCRKFPAYPTYRRHVIYRQSELGKCRSILSNYDRAYLEQINVADELSSILTASEERKFIATQKRSLLFRFLMYGFVGNAKDLLPEVRIPIRLRSPKNVLALIYAASGINLFPLVRRSIQLETEVLRKRWWVRELRQLKESSALLDSTR